MIPKHMMFFWANKEMSWLRFMTLYSFRKLNPSWKITLFLSEPNKVSTKTWGSSEQQDFHNFSGRDNFRNIEDIGIDIRTWKLEDREKATSDTTGASHKSNFFKWQQMANAGGFYSDLDILYVKPFDDFYQKCKNFDTVICHHGYFSIGLLGSSGNNRFFSDLYEHTFKRYSPHGYQSAGVISLYSLCGKYDKSSKPNWSTSFKAMIDHYEDVSFYNIPMKLVYPWTSSQMKHVFEIEHTSVPNECIGIHWYGGHPLAQKYNNILNEENFQDYKNTYGHFVKGLDSEEV